MVELLDPGTDGCQQQLVRFLAVALTLSAIVGIAAFAAAGTVAADQHEPENAPTYETFDGGVSFVVKLPDQTDHYPGNHPVHADNDNGYPDGYNASIEYFATGKAALTEQGADEGLWFDFIKVGADWIDYSECDATDNTKVFGIDRDNNNEGTKIDEDLIEHRKGSELKAGGLDVVFFRWDDLAGDPPYISPDDAIVAAQGAGSNGGPCLKMTNEPGWYQVQAYGNGTIANECKEEGNSDCEPDDKEWRGLNLNSNYVYICECDSEEEARETLGPPPNEEQTDDSTPSPTSTPTPDPGPADDSTPSATPTPMPNPGPADDSTPAEPRQNDQQNGGGNQEPAERNTPTIGAAPGFTPIAALVALFAATLLGYRRD